MTPLREGLKTACSGPLPASSTTTTTTNSVWDIHYFKYHKKLSCFYMSAKTPPPLVEN